MSNRKRQVTLLVLGILLALSVARFGYAMYLVQSVGFGDFRLFWEQVVSFLETGSLYPHDDPVATYQPSAWVYKFPPLYAALLIPLAKWGTLENVFLYHYILQLVLYGGFVVLALFMFRGTDPLPYTIVVLIMSLNYEPFIETIDVLQLETPFLLLLTLCLFFHWRRWDSWAGAILGFCAMLKVYPAFMLVYFVLKRRWAAVAGFAISVAVLFGCCLVVVGSRETIAYFLEVLPVLLRETSIVLPENLGMGKYLQSLGGLEAGTAKTVATILSVGVVLVSSGALYLNRKFEADEHRIALEYSLFIPVMLLCMPNSWVNYQLLLLLPMIVVVRGCWTGRGQRMVAIALLSAYVLTLFSAMASYSSDLLRVLPVPLPLLDTMMSLRVVSTWMCWLGALVLLREETSGYSRERAAS